MARIIVSAGHTNTDPGTVSGGLREVDLTRAISKRVIPHLRASGLITLSVPPNLDLAKRIEWINGTGYSSDMGDIAIEIHINDGGKSGFEFWYGGNKPNESNRLAKSIMSFVTSATHLEDQGVRSHTEHEYGTLAFVDKTNPIAVLLECLYIDNPKDLKKLKDESEIEKIALGIAKGILSYLNVDTKKADIQKKENNSESYSNTSKINGNSDYYSQNYSQTQKRQMTKQEREQMIITMYQRYLGRNPTQNDMNYFLNIGIDEDTLMKRMLNSQEHMDLVKAAQEYVYMRQKFETQNVEITRLKVESKDKDIMLNNMKQLLHQKNQHIGRLNTVLSTQSIVGDKQKGQAKNKKNKYKGSALDRIFHFFSGILT